MDLPLGKTSLLSDKLIFDVVQNEARRLSALHALDILNTAEEDQFSDLVRMASGICGMPISSISLVDSNRVWLKASQGLPGITEFPREIAFCSYAIEQDGIFVVPDVRADERFSNNPLVVGAPGIGFYAGVPLTLSNGQRVGTLCVLDVMPRDLTETQKIALLDLARIASIQLENRNAVREWRKVAHGLMEANEFISATLDVVRDGIVRVDMHGHITFVNAAAQVMMGLGLRRIKGNSLSRILPLQSAKQPLICDLLLAAAQQGATKSLPDDAILISKTGRSFMLEGKISPIRRATGELNGAVLILGDITDKLNAASDFAHQASHDALTGLANRQEFEARLVRSLKRSKESGSFGAVMYIDLDHFKVINENCGHSSGDEVLVQVAGLLKQSIRGNDTIARLGGDEFAIMLEVCPIQTATAIANKICIQLDEYRYTRGAQRFRVGASIGLIPTGGDMTNLQEVLQAADSCCYMAKETGRNRVVTWSNDDPYAAEHRGAAHWVERIESALDEDRFELYGQMIMPIGRSPEKKMEVLLRMIQPDGTMAPPAVFMPAAERFNLMPRLDRWVMRKSLIWLEQAAESLGIDRVSVNLSGQSLGDPVFQDWLLRELGEKSPSLCNRLIIEITETVAIARTDDASPFFKRLRDMGVAVALDDFGSGTASFAYLKKLSIDYLKIDGQFIKNLCSNQLDEATVRAFVDVAKVIGVKTVAEFVETQEIFDKLHAMGVDYAQGYLVHRPQQLKTFLRVITKHKAN